MTNPQPDFLAGLGLNEVVVFGTSFENVSFPVGLDAASEGPEDAYKFNVEVEDPITLKYNLSAKIILGVTSFLVLGFLFYAKSVVNFINYIGFAIV